MRKRWIYAVSSLLLGGVISQAMADVGFVKFYGSVLYSGCYVYGQQEASPLHKYSSNRSDVSLDLSYCRLSQKGEVLAEIRVFSPFLHKFQLFPLPKQDLTNSLIVVQDKLSAVDNKQQLRFSYSVPSLSTGTPTMFDFEIVYR